MEDLRIEFDQRLDELENPILNLDTGLWELNERRHGFKASGKRVDRRNHGRKRNRKARKFTHGTKAGQKNKRGGSIRMTQANYDKFQQVVRDLALPSDKIHKVWARLMELESEKTRLMGIAEVQGDYLSIQEVQTKIDENSI